MCAFLYDSAFCWDLPMGIFYLSTAGLNKRANVKIKKKSHAPRGQKDGFHVHPIGRLWVQILALTIFLLKLSGKNVSTRQGRIVCGREKNSRKSIPPSSPTLTSERDC